MADIIERPYERLIRYTKFETVSREGVDASPSTPEQTVFGRALVEELKSIGASEVAMDDNGYVYAAIPANIPDFKGQTVAFLSHMDVASASPCNNVKPRVVEYHGGDVELGNGVTLRQSDFPQLKGCIGKSLVVTDGSTLLGADDKAGIAEIMAMAQTLLGDDSIKHGTVKICFTPDEEIGSGAGLLDLKRLGADIAYTLDGDEFGAVEYETFNAADVTAAFTGVSVHPGSAKGILKNAALMAAEFICSMPKNERPENTEGHEGYFFAEGVEGGVESARVHCLIRDHDRDSFARRKETLIKLIADINARYGEGAAEISIEDSYYNMMEKVLPEHRDIVDAAYEAVRAAGGTPVSNPIRGGTDGAALSFRGLPCPNLGVGGGNFHSRLEYACCEDMDSIVKELIFLVRHYAKA